MARISGVDLPREKRVEIGPYLYLWNWKNKCRSDFKSSRR